MTESFIAGGFIVPGSAYTQVERIGRAFDGARLVTRPGSDLVIASAPLDEVTLILRRREFRAASYILSTLQGQDLHMSVLDGEADGDEIKIGETGDPASRLRTHLRLPPVAADRVWLIASLQPQGLGKDSLLALQHALTYQAIRAGRCRVYGAPPEAAWLAGVDPGLMGRWLSDAREMLASVGCYVLEAPGMRIAPAPRLRGVAGGGLPRAAAAIPDLVPLRSGYRIIPVGQTLTPTLPRRVLAWREVRASAVVLGDGSVVIEAGASFAGELRPGVQACIANKIQRMAAAGLLVTDGDKTRRLTRAIRVTSLTNAARLATASNCPGNALWQPAA